MSDLISKAAAIQAVFDWEQGKISGTIADAIAALPATDAREHRLLAAAKEARDIAIRHAALREAAAIATARWAARRERADHLAELDYPEAMIDAKTVSAKADEAEMIAGQILALIDEART